MHRSYMCYRHGMQCICSNGTKTYHFSLKFARDARQTPVSDIKWQILAECILNSSLGVFNMDKSYLDWNESTKSTLFKAPLIDVLCFIAWNLMSCYNWQQSLLSERKSCTNVIFSTGWRQRRTRTSIHKPFAATAAAEITGVEAKNKTAVSLPLLASGKWHAR